MDTCGRCNQTKLERNNRYQIYFEHKRKGRSVSAGNTYICRPCYALMLRYMNPGGTPCSESEHRKLSLSESY